MPVGIVIVVLAAVPSSCRLATLATPCDNNGQCPVGFWCDPIERFCVATAADRDASAIADRAADGQHLDVLHTDQALLDQAGHDHGGSADSTSVSDQGSLADGSGGVDALVGTDGAPLPDNAPRPDNALQPDVASQLDAVGTDGCSAIFGQLCARHGYCGATFDCQGSCTGGVAAPGGCSNCQYRTCQNLATWSPCQGGSCDVNSYCNGIICACAIDQCTAADDECSGETIYTCRVDAYGCGSWNSPLSCPNGCTSSPLQCLGVCNPGCVDGDGTCHNGSELAFCGCYGNACTDCTGYNECTQCDCM